MSSVKKRKTDESSNGKTKSNKGAAGEANNKIVGDGFEAFSLEDIQNKIGKLCHRVPNVPEGGLDADDQKAINEWASSLQAIVEEFNLLVCCVSPGTYKWGTERSGAADQNLNLLSAELGSSQDQISSTVTPRLTNVLAPVVDMVVEKVITTKEDGGKEIRENIYCRKEADPAFVKLCALILSRNAVLLRQVVLSNFHKIHKCIGDYRNACKKDSQHDSRGFAY